MQFRKDKDEATNLRAQGKSYREITAVLGVPKSTLSSWFGPLSWSSLIAQKNFDRLRPERTLLIKRINTSRFARLEKHYNQAREEASQQFVLYKDDRLFVASLMLYWGEGDKTLQNHLVRISNVDFGVHKIFARFLMTFCAIKPEKIKVWLLLYPNLDPDLCREKWKEELGLGDANFYKSQVILGKKPRGHLLYGVGNIIIGNKYLKVKILKWLELLRDDILNDKVAGMV